MCVCGVRASVCVVGWSGKGASVVHCCGSAGEGRGRVSESEVWFRVWFGVWFGVSGLEFHI